MIPLLPLLLTTLLYPTLSPAWVFTFRNGTNHATSFNDAQNNRSCTKIDNPEGSRFEWEPQSGPWCLYLYQDSNCTRGAGHTCRGIDWDHETSQDLKGFEVQTRPEGYDDPAKESGTTGAPSATVTVTSTNVPTDIAGSGSGSGSGGRKPLSGGGIAGVVIGVVAGVVLFAVLGFFLGKRAGRKQGEKDAAVAAAASGMQNDHGHSPAEEHKPATVTTSPTSHTQVGSPDSPVAGEQTYRPPGSRMVELVGNNGTTELSDTNRVMELDGSSAKPPLSPYRE